MVRYCVGCGKVIPEGRLEAIPDATHCVPCAEKLPKVQWLDPNLVCAKSSDTGRNGFAPNA